MTKIKGGTPNGQRNGAILKSVVENRPPILTNRQMTTQRKQVANLEEVYANFPSPGSWRR